MQTPKQRLLARLNKLGQQGLCIAFSGGVDSSLLLYLACQLNTPVLAVTFDTCLHPVGDIQAASAFAKTLRCEHVVLKVDELKDPRILQNPKERCYFCKHLLFSTLKEYAASRGFGAVIDGSNLDDTKEYRPGLRALQELMVVSPLMELGITKAQVRQMLKEEGLSVFSKPSSPCLATRLPYGESITREKLNQIAKAEEALHKLGFAACRVRMHQNIARIEVPTEAFLPLLQNKQALISALKALGFVYITLDLEGFRSGSMDLPQ